MAPIAEAKLSRSLRTVLAELPVAANFGDSEQFQEFLTGLEYFIPQVLSEIYPEWQHEGLDGIIPVFSRKIAEQQAEIFGLCILSSSQTLSPIHIQLQLATSTDEISWLECRLGEHGTDGMARLPYSYLDTLAKRLHSREGRPDSIDWSYKVTFGQRRSVT